MRILVILLIASIVFTCSCATATTLKLARECTYTGKLTSIQVLETSGIDNWARVNMGLRLPIKDDSLENVYYYKESTLINIYVRLNELPEVINGQTVCLENLGPFALSGRNIYSIMEIK